MKEKLKELLSLRKTVPLADDSRIPAAVLVPLYNKDGQYHILFTKRTDTVKTHKRQISFPGGSFQDEDRNLEETALRECTEEIGLAAQDVEMLGELDPTPSVASNYIIKPFVGVIPCPYQFKLNEEETDEIIEVPISALLDGSCHQRIETTGGEVLTSDFYNYQGTVIWGATARILDQFVGILSGLQNR